MDQIRTDSEHQRGRHKTVRRFPSTRRLLERLVARAVRALRPAQPRPRPVLFEALEPRILLSADPSLSPDFARQVEGALDVPGEVDRYGFTLEEPARIALDSLTNNGNLRWSLSGPRGAIVNDRPLSSTDSIDGSSYFDLVPGDYTIAVDGVGDTTGGYGFRLLNLDAASPIAPGEVVSGTLNPASETDAYKFSATAGERFFFDRSQSTGDAYWRLLDPFGRSVWGPTHTNTDVGPTTLDYDGSYTLLVEGRRHETVASSYSFVMHRVADDLAAMTLGTPIEGEIALPGQGDVYTLELAAATRVYFDARTNASDFRWSLNGPRGGIVSEQRFNQSDAANGATVLDLVAGMYQLSVQTTGDTTGAYGFELIDLAAAALLVPGEAVSGTLEPANRTHAYRFDALAGSRYYFDRTVGASGGTVDWRLLDPFGNTVFGASSINDVDVLALGYSGTYTLLIEGRVANAGAAASYGFRVQPVADASNALTLGAPVAGTIEHTGQRQHYTFSLAAERRVYFDSQSGDSSFRWSLSGPRGQVVSDRSLRNSDSADGSSIFDLAAGDYVLTVDANDDVTGAFAFRLLDLAAATALTPGTEVSGTLDPAAETDVFSFEAVAGDRFDFDRLTLSGSTPYWRLLDPFGREVFGPSSFNDVTGQSLDFSGLYTLLLEGRSFSTDPTSYSFNVLFQGNTPPAALPDGTALIVGTSVAGTLATAAERDVYRFSLGEQRRLYFDAQTNNGSLRWELVGPRGVVVSNRAFTGSDSLSGLSVFDLTPGDYALTIFNTAGDYRFNLLDLGAAAEIAPGTTLAGTLDPANSTLAYRFSAVAGERFYFDARIVSGDTYYRLLDPFGRVYLGPTYVNNDTDVTTLAYSGEYTLLVEGRVHVGGTAAFEMRVQKVSDDAAALALGALVSGAIAHPGQRDLYSFDLATTTRVYFDSQTNNGNFLWRMSGPRGLVAERNFIGSDASDGTSIFDLVAGSYTLAVDPSGANGGDYAFRLLDLAEATPAAANTPMSGTLSPANSTQLYRFNASAGERFFFDGSFSGGDTRWRLIDPYGRTYWGPTGMNSDVDVTALAYEGEYVLAVEGRYYVGGTSDYTFTLQRVVDDAATLVLGEQVQSAIAHAGQRDLYTFTLSDTTRVYFDNATTSVPIRWSLSGPTGAVISNRLLYTSDSIDGTSIFALAPGSYTLTIDADGATTGDYSFRLLDLAHATDFVPGEQVSGTLTPARETDVYRFDAEAGERFYFEGTISGGDTYWRLLDPFGGTVWGPSYINNDVDVTPLAFSGQYTLLVEGRYYLNGDSAYSFTIHPVTDKHVAIEIGEGNGGATQTIEGALGSAVLLDGIRHIEVAHDPLLDLTGSSTVEMWVKVDQLPGSWTALFYKGNGNSSQRTLSLWLRSDGLLHLSTGDGGNQAIETATGVLMSGAWHHVAGVFDRGTGAMRILVDGVERAQGALRTTAAIGGSGPMLFGYPAEGYEYFRGALDDIRVWNAVRTQAEIQAGKDAPIDVAPGALALYLKADQASGETLADSSGHDLAADVVRQWPNATDVVFGYLDRPGQRALYTFSVDHTTRVYFDNLTNTGELRWSLSGPRGTLVSQRPMYQSDSADGTSIFELVAGDYTLTVDGNADARGAYAFRLLNLADAVSYEPGTSTSGTLTPARETDVYTFSAEAGERFYFEGTISGGDTYWRLLDPFGGTVWGPSYINNDVDVTTAAFSGQYTLLVEGRYYLGGDSAYSFNVQPVVDEEKALVVGASQGLETARIAGALGAAVVLDGVRHIELAPDPQLDLTGSSTFEMWIKVDQLPGSWTPVFYQGGSTSSQRTASLWLRSDGLLHLSTSDGGNQTVETAPGALTPGAWHHVAGVFDRGNGLMRILVDGVERAQGSLRTTPAVASTGPVLFGYPAEGYEYFRGALDDIRIWNVVRSNAEIAAARSAPLETFPASLVAYLRADEQAGEALVDATDNGRDGAIVHAWGRASSSVMGSIDTAGERHVYTFELSDTRRIYFDSLTNSSELRWSLSGPRGVLVSDRPLNGSDSADGLSLFELVAGQYRLTIDGRGANTGIYGFRLLDLAAAAAIDPGTVYSAQVDPANSTRMFRFEAAAGERYYFDGTLNGGDTYWRLLDPFGRVFFGASPIGNDVDVITLPYAGEYTLLVEGRYYVGGIAGFSFNVQPVADETSALTLGATVEAALAHAGQRDSYTFTLGQRSALYFDAQTHIQ